MLTRSAGDERQLLSQQIRRGENVQCRFVLHVLYANETAEMSKATVAAAAETLHLVRRSSRATRVAGRDSLQSIK